MYRDANYAARCRSSGQMSEDLSPELTRLAAMRDARTIGGLVGLVAFAGVVTVLATLALRRGLPLQSWTTGRASWLLLTAWPSMLGCGLAVYTWLRVWPARPARIAEDELTAAVLRDSRATQRWQLDRLEATEGRSFSLLGAAIALLVPLTAHLLFAILVGQPSFRMRDFDGYMGLALACTWLPHLAVAICAWRYFERARARLSAGDEPHPVLSGLAHSGVAAVTTIVSVVIPCLFSHICSSPA